ncbi:hypothetical protein ACOME3_002868 [Neoechinorhynchus agilis]
MTEILKVAKLKSAYRADGVGLSQGDYVVVIKDKSDGMVEVEYRGKDVMKVPLSILEYTENDKPRLSRTWGSEFKETHDHKMIQNGSRNDEPEHKYGIVISDYMARSPDEITLIEGEIVKVLSIEQNEIWGEIYGRKGRCPAHCLDIIENIDDVPLDNTSEQYIVSEPSSDVYETLSETNESMEMSDGIITNDLPLDILEKLEFENEQVMSVYRRNLDDILDKLCLFERTKTALMVFQDPQKSEQNEQLIFCNVKIAQLDRELDRAVGHILSSTNDPSTVESINETKAKRQMLSEESMRLRETIVNGHQQRTKQEILHELISGETVYLLNLRIIWNRIVRPSERFLTVHERCMLFAGLQAVAKFANQLLKDINCNSDRVVDVFYSKIGQMQDVYKKYGELSDKAQCLLKPLLQSNQELRFRFDRVLLDVRNELPIHNIEDGMGSGTYKPPLRLFLQYKIIFGKIREISNDADSFKASRILSACEAITEGVDEFKRRRDLISKYCEGNRGLFIKRLTTRSLAKKSSRFRYKVESFMGLRPKYQDDTFERCRLEFNSMQKQIDGLHGTIKKYIKCVKNLMEIDGQLWECVSDLTGTRTTNTLCLPDFNPEEVLKKLQHLKDVRSRPAALIQKRDDKLADYNLASTNEDIDEKKWLFASLNGQLCLDLPVLQYHCTMVQSV